MPLTNQEVVQLLCPFVKEEMKHLDGKGKKMHLVYKCPNGDSCMNPNAEISFQKGSGYTNPFNHFYIKQIFNRQI